MKWHPLYRAVAPKRGVLLSLSGQMKTARASVPTELTTLPGLFGNRADVPTRNMHRNVPTGTKAR